MKLPSFLISVTLLAACAAGEPTGFQRSVSKTYAAEFTFVGQWLAGGSNPISETDVRLSSWCTIAEHEGTQAYILPYYSEPRLDDPFKFVIVKGTFERLSPRLIDEIRKTNVNYSRCAFDFTPFAHRSVKDNILYRFSIDEVGSAMSEREHHPVFRQQAGARRLLPAMTRPYTYLLLAPDKSIVLVGTVH